jgi:hypothetical protein
MKHGAFSRPGSILAALILTSVPAVAQTSITTSQFNNSRTAANLNETALNGANVNVSSFGKLYSFSVDARVYAQPLYVSGLPIAGARTDVLYVATMSNTVYAFDAGNASRGPLRQRTLAPATPSGQAGTCPDLLYTGTQLGILSTPVADTVTQTLYVVASTPSGPGTYVSKLFALDMLTLLDRVPPVTVSASVPGAGAQNSGGTVTLNQTTQIQRAGLVLANATVYAGFGSCGPDPQPYHGWLIGYNAATLRQTVVFNASPNGSAAAIWQSGRAPVSDAAGSIYFFTGNGTNNQGTDLADSVLKLSPLGVISDWFTPPNFVTLDQRDLDLSAGGPLLTPDSNLIVGGGKDGMVYVLDPNSMGKAGAPLQAFQATAPCSQFTEADCFQIHSIAYWNSSTPTLYVWGANDTLRAYRASGRAFATSPQSQSGQPASFPGGILAVSSNGSQPGTGIVWATTNLGILHAFDASQVNIELWNSNLNASRDGLGEFSRFGQPVIANGRVFVPTYSNTVVAYGLLGLPPAAPSNLTFTVDFTASGQVSLVWTDNSNNESGFSIERSTDNVNFSQIATVGPNVTTYSDRNVALYTFYYYRVRSYNSFGFSGYSNAAAYFVL